MTDMVDEMKASRWRRGAWRVIDVLAVVAGAAGATLGLWTAASAETVCVACVEPEQRYRCEVQADGGESGLRAAPLTCAARIAQDNGHSSCAVTQSGKPCDGIVKVYRASDLIPHTDALAPSSGAPGGANDEADAPNEEPATVADMTKNTLDNSRENVRKAGQAINDAGERAHGAISGAGEAVGNAAKRTLNCLGGGDC